MTSPIKTLLLLGLLIGGVITPFFANATTLPSPVQGLISANGSHTSPANATYDLSSVTLPTLNVGERLTISIQHNTQSFTSQQARMLLDGQAVVFDTITHNVNDIYFTDCTFWTNQASNTNIQYYCEERRNSVAGSIAQNIGGLSVTNYTTTGLVLKLQHISGGASRIMKWAWQVQLYTNDLDTSVTEEDNLSHIQVKQDGSTIYTNPSSLDLIGDCLTAENLSGTEVTIDDNCTGGGGGGDSEMTNTIINELFGLILVIGSIITFLVAFFIGKSLVKRR